MSDLIAAFAVVSVAIAVSLAIGLAIWLATRWIVSRALKNVTDGR